MEGSPGRNETWGDQMIKALYTLAKTMKKGF